MSMPILWIVLPLSLLSVIVSCAYLSTAAAFRIAFLLPLAFAFLFYVAAVFWSSAPYSPGWALIGSFMLFVPTVLVCLIAAAIFTFLKRRADRKKGPTI
jgi:hypothetical protein